MVASDATGGGGGSDGGTGTEAPASLLSSAVTVVPGCQDFTLAPCQCQTRHPVAFAIVRYSNGILCLLERNDVRRLLATFFSFLTVVFVLASNSQSKSWRYPGGTFLNIPAFRYLLSTGVLATLYSMVRLSDGLWEIAIRACCRSWLSYDYITFIFDLILGYLLLSSSSVAVLGVDQGHRSNIYPRDRDWAMPRSSIAWSFATFFFVSISSLVSGYKLCKRIICTPLSSNNELDGLRKWTVDMAVADDTHGTYCDDADPGRIVGSPATASTVNPVSPPLAYGDDMLSSPPNMVALLVHHSKQNYVCRSMATFYSLLSVSFLLAAPNSRGKLLDIPAFRYLLSTGIIAFAYSSIQLMEEIRKNATKVNILNKAFHYGTFIFDMVLSYLLLSSSSVAVLGLSHRSKFDFHKNDRLWTWGCISIAWSFATFFFVTGSSLHSGCKLCKMIIWPSISDKFDNAKMRKLLDD